MRRLRLLFGRRARREYAPIAVDLHRIGVDDLRAPALGQSDRHRRLAARGRSCDEERANHAHFNGKLVLPFVATLVAPTDAANLGDALVRRAAQAIPGVVSSEIIETGI